MKIKQNKGSETNFCRFFSGFSINPFIYVVTEQFLSNGRKDLVRKISVRIKVTNIESFSKIIILLPHLDFCANS